MTVEGRIWSINYNGSADLHTPDSPPPSKLLGQHMWLFIFRVVCVIPYNIFEDSTSGEPEGGRVLPIMAYTGPKRLRPKGVPFLGFRYMKE